MNTRMFYYQLNEKDGVNKGLVYSHVNQSHNFMNKTNLVCHLDAGITS